MDIAALQPATLMADLPLEHLAGNPQLSEATKVAELARQFESVLLRQILTAARKTVIPSNGSSDSATTGIYQDMINYQLADSISQSGDFGVARSLQAQLARQLPSDPQPGSAVCPPPSPNPVHLSKAHHD
jgi:Rod binding domain-containing protein